MLVVGMKDKCSPPRVATSFIVHTRKAWELSVSPSIHPPVVKKVISQANAQKLLSKAFPGSEITQQRGGIHNSVTRITPKPTHMIGGYAHLAYGFNYYGTVGSNRDEFVVVRKMKNIDWLDGEGNDQVQESVK